MDVCKTLWMCVQPYGCEYNLMDVFNLMGVFNLKGVFKLMYVFKLMGVCTCNLVRVCF